MPAPVPDAGTPATTEQTIAVILWLYIENGSKFTRGKKRVIDDVWSTLASDYQGSKLDRDSEYRIVFEYEDEADLKEQIDELMSDIHDTADRRNCVMDFSIKEEATGRYWDEYDGGWK
jgi:hypothetical protein